MAIDTETPGSPGWWIQLLATELHNRRVGRAGKRRFTRRAVESIRIRPGIELLADYLRGDPPLRDDIHSSWAAPYRQFLRMGRMNIAPKLVSATANRMRVQDFRTAQLDDELGDVEARRLMRRNKLKRKAREVHDLMLGLGDSYTIVTPPDATRDWSLITAESPMECITYDDPATGQTLAGLKMFRDHAAGVDYAYLFLPGELWVAKAEVPASTLFGTRPFLITDTWDWDEDKFDDVPNNRVAMVHFRNKDGVSEIEGQLDTLDRINDKLFNEWWIGKLQAFKQRALEVPDEEEDESVATGGVEAIEELTDAEWAEIFTSAPDAIWRIPKGSKLWETKESDLRQLVDSIKAELQWLAFTSSKPMHLITPDATNGSAEGASTQKEEHTFEIYDRQDRADEAWAETIAMAFEFQGMTDRADVTEIETMWGPIETHSLQERTQAAQNVKGYLPDEAIDTDIMGYPPAEVIERIRGQRNRQRLHDAVPAARPKA